MSNTTDTPQKVLSEHLCFIQNQTTQICMKHWRALLEDKIEDIEEVRETLVMLEKRIQYAKNCCYWIKTELEDKKPAKATNNTDP